MCLRGWIASVGERWREEGGVETDSGTIFAMYFWTTIGATRPTATVVPEAKNMREGSWSPDLFMVHVRANMEDPVLVLEVLQHAQRNLWDNRDKGLYGAGNGKRTTLPVNVKHSWGFAIGTEAVST